MTVLSRVSYCVREVKNRSLGSQMDNEHTASYYYNQCEEKTIDNDFYDR